MKMTKIESARIIAESTDNPVCRSILCSKCFNSRKGKACKDGNLVAIEKAKAYIKRHESKSKKKDHILDTTKKVDTYHKKLKKDYVGLKPVKVTRPNFQKYLRDKIDMKVRVNPELSEELQKICFRENVFWTGGIKDIQSGKEFLFISNTSKHIKSYNIKSESTELLFSQHIECKEYNPKTDTLVEKVEEPKPIKTVGIDNSDVTLAQHEPVKDCHVNSEYPDPIRVDIPDIFYCPTHQGILRFKRSHIILKDTNNEDCLLKLHDEYPCYRTLEEALQVAKKLWNGDGKCEVEE